MPSTQSSFKEPTTVLHPAQEEACLANILAAVRPDLGARNPCVLTAVAAARAFFLGGHLASGLLHVDKNCRLSAYALKVELRRLLRRKEAVQTDEAGALETPHDCIFLT